jgi:hypothetical protein
MKIRNFTNIIFLLVLIFCTTSCAKWVVRIFPNRPDREFKEDKKDATPEFQQGWRDGCEVGMANGSNTFYKAFYDNNRADGYKMTGSPDYKTAWGNAFWYCYRYDAVKQKSSIWGSMFSGYR